MMFRKPTVGFCRVLTCCSRGGAAVCGGASDAKAKVAGGDGEAGYIYRVETKGPTLENGALRWKPWSTEAGALEY